MAPSIVSRFVIVIRLHPAKRERGEGSRIRDPPNPAAPPSSYSPSPLSLSLSLSSTFLSVPARFFLPTSPIRHHPPPYTQSAQPSSSAGYTPRRTTISTDDDHDHDHDHDDDGGGGDGDGGGGGGGGHDRVDSDHEVVVDELEKDDDGYDEGVTNRGEGEAPLRSVDDDCRMTWGRYRFRGRGKRSDLRSRSSTHP